MAPPLDSSSQAGPSAGSKNAPPAAQRPVSHRVVFGGVVRNKQQLNRAVPYGPSVPVQQQHQLQQQQHQPANAHPTLVGSRQGPLGNLAVPPPSHLNAHPSHPNPQPHYQHPPHQPNHLHQPHPQPIAAQHTRFTTQHHRQPTPSPQQPPNQALPPPPPPNSPHAFYRMLAFQHPNPAEQLAQEFSRSAILHARLMVSEENQRRLAGELDQERTLTSGLVTGIGAADVIRSRQIEQVTGERDALREERNGLRVEVDALRQERDVLTGEVDRMRDRFMDLYMAGEGGGDGEGVKEEEE